MRSLPHITGVEALGGYRLRLTFDDGVVGVVDLGDELWGPGVRAARRPNRVRPGPGRSRTRRNRLAKRGRPRPLRTARHHCVVADALHWLGRRESSAPSDSTSMFVSALAVRAGGLGLDPLALLLDVERAAAVTRSPNGDHSGRSSPCMCRGATPG